jgi:hypothetical protein
VLTAGGHPRSLLQPASHGGVARSSHVRPLLVSPLHWPQRLLLRPHPRGNSAGYAASAGGLCQRECGYIQAPCLSLQSTQRCQVQSAGRRRLSSSSGGREKSEDVAEPWPDNAAKRTDDDISAMSIAQLKGLLDDRGVDYVHQCHLAKFKKVKSAERSLLEALVRTTSSLEPAEPAPSQGVRSDGRQATLPSKEPELTPREDAAAVQARLAPPARRAADRAGTSPRRRARAGEAGCGAGPHGPADG